MQIAFILLQSLPVLELHRIKEALERALPEEGPILVLDGAPSDRANASAGFELADATHVFIVPVAAGVPDAEADNAAKFSMSAHSTGWILPVHHAHLVVTMLDDNDKSLPFESLLRFTRVLAGLINGIDGVVGIYWGAAGATHEPEFFRSAALDYDALPTDLWNGVSVADDGKRVTLVSLGMAQLGLPELKLTSPRADFSDALDFFFDLLSLAARRGEAIAAGDTVGRSDDEHLRVRYESSPMDPETVLWCVDLPPAD